MHRLIEIATIRRNRPQGEAAVAGEGVAIEEKLKVAQSPSGLIVTDSDSTGTTIWHLLADGSVQTGRENIRHPIQVHVTATGAICTSASPAGFEVVSVEDKIKRSPISDSGQFSAGVFLAGTKKSNPLLIGQCGNTLSVVAGAEDSAKAGQQTLSTTLDLIEPSLVQAVSSSAGERSAVAWIEKGTARVVDLTNMSVNPDTVALSRPVLNELAAGRPVVLYLTYDPQARLTLHILTKEDPAKEAPTGSYTLHRLDNALSLDPKPPITSIINNAAADSFQMVSDDMANTRVVWRDITHKVLMTAVSSPNSELSTPQVAVDDAVDSYQLVGNSAGTQGIVYLNKEAKAGLVTGGMYDNRWLKTDLLVAKPVNSVAADIDGDDNYLIAAGHPEYITVYKKSNA